MRSKANQRPHHTQYPHPCHVHINGNTFASCCTIVTWPCGPTVGSVGAAHVVVAVVGETARDCYKQMDAKAVYMYLTIEEAKEQHQHGCAEDSVGEL